MKSNKILFIALIAAFLLTALPARAAILPACATNVDAVLQLSCFLNLLISVSNFILGLTGSLALLFFVYGGFVFLTSRGSADQVTKGKTILTQAVIGIIIIFGAYLAVNFLVANVLKAKFTTEIPKEAKPAAPTTPAPTLNNAAGAGATIQQSGSLGTDCACACDNGGKDTTPGQAACKFFCSNQNPPATMTSCNSISSGSGGGGQAP